MVVAVLFLVVVVLALLTMRRLRALRSGGVHAALRTRLDDSAKGWHLGVGRYRGDEFVWFRVLSLRPGPDRVIHRTAGSGRAASHRVTSGRGAAPCRHPP